MTSNHEESFIWQNTNMNNNNIPFNPAILKFGPYDYFKGNDLIIKLPNLFINSILFIEAHGTFIL